MDCVLRFLQLENDVSDDVLGGIFELFCLLLQKTADGGGFSCMLESITTALPEDRMLERSYLIDFSH